ncbi:pyroglutamyl-peptidase I [Devriesea agamarum]|uniref:pyroglutamyl-peptidase I n=1 Tax=Devriesea agamarum TaxID=472569 RepID=UPI00071D680E|nr:pyroglutamyl-peptidase I [Devriesea agamarum]
MGTDVLLTGFAPFGGNNANPSWGAVCHAQELLSRYVDVEVAEIPVTFGTAEGGGGAQVVLDLIAQHRPRLVIATGLASGRTAVTVERVAVNIRDARIPDNDGAQPIDEPCIPSGPVGYFSTLPLKRIVHALTCDDIPAAVSQTAGTYVCNDVFYRLMHVASTNQQIRWAGFIHVPAVSDLPARTSGIALARAVDVTLNLGSDASDMKISGGSEH